MNLKKIQIELNISDVQQMQMATMDDDKNEALPLIKSFIKRLEQQKQQGMKSHLDG